MNTCLLIDDESASRVVLRELIQRFCKDLDVIGECNEVDSAAQAISDLKPDLIFLDIHMPGKDGFELLKHFPEPDFDIIFITSYDQFAVKAFRFNALDYLLKPVDIDELLKAVQKFKEKKQLRISKEVAENIHRFDALSPKITVHDKGIVHLIPLLDVVCFEAEVNYSRAITRTGQSFLQSRSLSEVEPLLADHPEFLRIHKSTIINSHFVESYSKGETCILTMSTGHMFEVSRRRKTELLHKLSTL